MQSLMDQTLRNQKEKQTSETIQRWDLKKDGVKYAVPHLSKKMWFCFSLIIITTLPLIASLIYEVGSQRLHVQIVESILGPPNTVLSSSPVLLAKKSETGGAAIMLKRLQNRMILVMSAVFLAVIVAFLVFMHRIIKPLDEIGRATFKMAHGQLDELVPVREPNEIGKIGESINDLAIDLQEILLHVWNHTRQDIVLMERIAPILSSQPVVNGLPAQFKENFYLVKQDIEDMRDMVKAFNYYHVRLEEEKVLVNETPRLEGEYHV
jgi:methyl-accepting chemotaxis protein